MVDNPTGDPRDEDAWDWTIAEVLANPLGALGYIRRLEAALALSGLRSVLLRYSARHERGCPQNMQGYWRMRSEYRPKDYGPDKPCNCGLDELLGRVDDRQVSR